MFWKQKKISTSSEKNVLLVMIEEEIRAHLANKGVTVSGLNISMNTDTISLNIVLKGSKRLALESNTLAIK